MATFKALGVSEDLIKALEEMGIQSPTEIQEEAIPFLIKEGTDFIGQAQTGTGKTAAFGLPLLQSINASSNNVQALVLAPTRELGQQIAKQLFKYTKHYHKIFAEAVYGGAPIDKQIAALKRPTQIIVATPGRLIDLIKRKAVDIRKVRTVVLDEADEMLSRGFKKELDEILEMTNGDRDTWLFSATMPKELKSIIETYMAFDAKRVVVDQKNVVNKNIIHQYVLCENADKLNVLIQFLKSQGDNRGVIFCKTKVTVRTLSKQLQSKNFKADAIYGDLLQKERDKVMRAFVNESLQVLVASDMAARGIDVKNLSYVVHYNLPDQIEYYTHRSGRTARAGNKGISLSLVSKDEVTKMRYIQNKLGIVFDRVR